MYIKHVQVYKRIDMTSFRNNENMPGQYNVNRYKLESSSASPGYVYIHTKIITGQRKRLRQNHRNVYGKKTIFRSNRNHTNYGCFSNLENVIILQLYYACSGKRIIGRY